MQKKITLGVESEGLPLQLTQLINSVEFTNVTKYLTTFNQKQINCNQRLNKLNQLNASLLVQSLNDVWLQWTSTFLSDWRNNNSNSYQKNIHTNATLEVNGKSARECLCPSMHTSMHREEQSDIMPLTPSIGRAEAYKQTAIRVWKENKCSNNCQQHMHITHTVWN